MMVRISLQKVWVDSLVHDEEILKLLIKKVGEDKIVMGSDYPFPLGEIDRPGKLIEKLDSDDVRFQEKLFHHNAITFLYGSKSLPINK